MSDLFQDKAEESFVRQVWHVMERAHWHSFQILTKRPDRMLDVLSKPVFPDAAECLARHVGRKRRLRLTASIRLLRRVPARVRFVSFEPLLGPILDPDLNGIHWAIVGGESGPRARPMESWWVEELHDSCKRQRVAFFFKQWGGKRKKKTGRMLAGRVWEEYPKQARL